MNVVFGLLPGVLALGAAQAELLGQARVPVRTEVVLIGTIHHFQLLHPDNTPAHLRAVLSRIRPDVIALENLPDWQRIGRHLWTQLPEYYVAEEYGRENQVPIVGIAGRSESACSWREPALEIDREQRFRHSVDGLRRLGAWEALMAFGEQGWSFTTAQDRIDFELMEPFLHEALRDSASVRFHNALAQQVIAVARQHRGRRVAVVVGSSALYPLRMRLAVDSGIALIDVREFLPAQSDVDAGRRVTDAVLLLGASLDGWSVPNMPHARNHQRTSALLAWLETHDAEGLFTTYYRAKWHTLFGRYEQAAQLLSQFIGADRDTELPWLPNSEWAWPPWGRLRHKALFARAVLHDLTGERAAAQKVYRDLLTLVPAEQLSPRVRGPDSYYDLRAYLTDLIREPYRGGPWEAFRVQEARRCWSAGRKPSSLWPH